MSNRGRLRAGAVGIRGITVDIDMKGNGLELPRKVAKGEPVKAEQFNALIDALGAVVLAPGKGYQRRITKGGTVLMIRDHQRDPKEPDFSPFAVIEAEEPTAGNWELELEPGRVRCANPVEAANGNDGWDYYVPTIGGVPMDQKDANGRYPVVEVQDGEWVYCKIRRDAEGMISETPEIVVDAADEESSHYQPPDPYDSGTEEVYQLVRILEFAEVDNQAEITYWRKSDIDLVAQLWAGENIGDGGEHFKEHDETTGRWKFRRTHGRYGTDADTVGDSVTVDFDGENLPNTSGGGGAEIYKTPTPQEIAAGDTAKFRPAVQGPSGRRELTIEQDGDMARFMGNDYTQTLFWTNCTGSTVPLVECRDGFVVFMADDIFAGCSHYLYGSTHLDVNVGDAPGARDLLQFNNGNAKFELGTRMNWKGEYEAGTYEKDDVVLDGQWTMVANKQTTDQAAPQPGGDETWFSDVEGTLVPTGQAAQAEAVWIVMNEFVIQSGASTTGLRMQVPENSGNFTYSVWAIVNRGTPGEMIEELLSPFVPTSARTWIDVPRPSALWSPGTRLALALVTRAVSQPSSLEADWDQKNENGNPDSGNMNFQNNQTQIRVHKTDKDDVDQSTQLEAITEGGTISFAGNVWLITGVSDNGSHMRFTVEPDNQRPGEATRTVNFEWGSVAPIPQDYQAGFWANNPNAHGLSGPSLSNLTQSNDGFGVDVYGSSVVASEDWDVVAYSGGGSISGGEALPDGTAGDVIYHNGTEWVTLLNPGDPSPNEAWALFHNGTAPYWDPVV